jgi:hypothetical protein
VRGETIATERCLAAAFDSKVTSSARQTARPDPALAAERAAATSFGGPFSPLKARKVRKTSLAIDASASHVSQIPHN